MLHSRLALFALASLAAAFGSCPSARLLAAELNYPLAIAAREGGEIYLADRNLPGVWQVKDGALSLYFEGSKKFRTPLNAVRCLALDKQGKLLAGDSSTREVYRFDDAGAPVPLTKGGIGIPMSVAVNKEGELFVADLEVHRVWKVPENGGKPEKFAEVAAPCGLAFDASGALWVVSRGREQLFRISPEGQIEVIVKSRVMNFPHNIALDAAGTAYITDGYEKAVWKLPPGGEPVKWVSGAPFDNPVGICWQGPNLLVVDPRAKAVFSLTPEGQVSKLEWSAR